ncbi:Uncharacterised protein [Chlamydia trachomatis]|nr:Uncharacterised protein [Chlamydia trachomatis]
MSNDTDINDTDYKETENNDTYDMNESKDVINNNTLHSNHANHQFNEFNNNALKRLRTLIISNSMSSNIYIVFFSLLNDVLALSMTLLIICISLTSKLLKYDWS